MLIANQWATVLVAETSGKVVGMATGQLTISTAEGGPALLVEDVVVAPATAATVTAAACWQH